jgi:hypothetical protein
LQTKEKTDSTERSPDGRSHFFTFFKAPIATNSSLVSPFTVQSVGSYSLGGWLNASCQRPSTVLLFRSGANLFLPFIRLCIKRKIAKPRNVLKVKQYEQREQTSPQPSPFVVDKVDK